jgi:DNA-binding MarR family transcriptional regulator
MPCHGNIRIMSKTAKNPRENPNQLRTDLANRLYFKLYQCANMLHKTGTKAVEAQGLTTQQWAVMGALSRPETAEGMGMGELARYLLVSRQNLTGLLSRMEAAGYVHSVPDPADKRSRLVQLTPAGQQVWQHDAAESIGRYYEQALEGFSSNDMVHTLHYLLKLLDNMKAIDAQQNAGKEES